MNFQMITVDCDSLDKFVDSARMLFRIHQICCAVYNLQLAIYDALWGEQATSLNGRIWKIVAVTWKSQLGAMLEREQFWIKLGEYTLDDSVMSLS